MRCENCGGDGRVQDLDCGHDECRSGLQAPGAACTVLCCECNGVGEITDAAPEGIVVGELRLIPEAA